MYDPNSADVFFDSCETLVRFKNPSDAAIARLSAAGFTESAVQTVLDVIVTNPVFNPQEVTLKSTWSIDEAIAEHRRKQAEKRSAYDHRGAPRVGGPPVSIVRLVASHAYKGMPPFGADVQTWCSTREAEEICYLLRNMSRVHRSWTTIAQDLLFRRVKISSEMHRDKIRALLQHPYLSRVCEFICEVHCDEDHDSDEDQRLDNESLNVVMDYAIHLLRRMGPLRYLSVEILSNNDIDDESFKNHCSDIHSQVSCRLPNLKGLWLVHHDVGGLRQCVESVVGRLDGSLINLKKLGVFITRRGRMSGASFSPVILWSLDQTKDLEASKILPDVQESEIKPENNGTRDVFFDFMEQYPLGAFLSCLFDRDMRSAVLGDIFPEIRRLTVRYPYMGKLQELPNYDEFRDVPANEQKLDTDTNINWFLSRLLKKSTTLAHIELVFSEDCDFAMKTLPILDFPASTEVVSIYLPENGRDIANEILGSNLAMALSIVRGSPSPGSEFVLGDIIDSKRKKCSCGLDHLTKQLCRRPGTSALKRVEVIFCRELDTVLMDLGLEATIEDVKNKSHETGVPFPPLFLLPIWRQCRAEGVDFVVRESILFVKS